MNHTAVHGRLATGCRPWTARGRLAASGGRPSAAPEGGLRTPLGVACGGPGGRPSATSVGGLRPSRPSPPPPALLPHSFRPSPPPNSFSKHAPRIIKTMLFSLFDKNTPQNQHWFVASMLPASRISKCVGIRPPTASNNSDYICFDIICSDLVSSY